MSRGIRATAWALVVAGVAAPAMRRRLRLPAPVVLGAAWSAPVALSVVAPPGKVRQVAVSALNMWAYIAAYEMPHDQPERLARRARVRYPIVADRLLGLGVLPTVRLQRAFSAPGKVNRFERLLVFSHWIWFFTPHGALAYILLRRGDRFPAAAARMYTVFDLGAIFYWAIPTAPPWWAAAEGRLDEGREVEIRRMMIEYGPVFWGDLWQPLYSFLGGNPLAAMPSLHFATSLMGAHLLSEVGPVSGAVGWGYAGMLGLALVYLGEHYLVDLLAGALLTETVRAAAPGVAPLARRLVGQIDAVRARLSEG
ncbi:MAG TPA: phosphatase PAP2 family protein [Solirubrobacteraceae bacterium]|nr:phosphatase PAP2 family protein [Solirubrobacteraceae bacterium]